MPTKPLNRKVIRTADDQRGDYEKQLLDTALWFVNTKAASDDEVYSRLGFERRRNERPRHIPNLRKRLRGAFKAIVQAEPETKGDWVQLRNADRVMEWVEVGSKVSRSMELIDCRCSLAIHVEKVTTKEDGVLKTAIVRKVTVLPTTIVPTSLRAFLAYVEFLASRKDRNWRLHYDKMCERYFLDTTRERHRPPITCGLKQCKKEWAKLKKAGKLWEDVPWEKRK